MANEIYRRYFARTPWLRLMQRGEFPSGMGESISVLTYERSAPTDAEPAWTDVLIQDGQEGGECLPPVTKVGIGSTTRSFNLKRRVLEGPDFCAEEFRSPFALQKQLDSITSILGQYARLEWEIRDRHEYFRMVKRKVVVDGCPPHESNTQAATYPAFCPTSILTQGILNRYAIKLLRDGADDSAMMEDNGRKILTLICSAETSDNLIFQNADIRQDLRWGQPSELLKPIITDGRVYRGFIHIIDPYPRRFTCSAGVYTEVPAFLSVAASKGNKSDINPSYETAPYEETFVFDPMVMRQLIPRPITNPAANFSFNPVNYTGIWAAKNIPDRRCNPDNNIIFHRGIMAAASEPVYPERGMAFVHLRCDPACSLITSCPS
jgi:hypothetical protein